MQRLIAWLRGHLRLVVAAAAFGAALLVFVLVWFQPQKLLIDQTVDEVAPSGEALAAGTFAKLRYDSSGSASVVEADDGSLVLHIDELRTQNGPDLFVYLSEAPPDADAGEHDDAFIDLGRLQGNVGSSNYTIPAGTDLDRYPSVVIWCKRFSVGFAVAALS